jgi:uncharacterized protein YidB (DUF937 family)
MFKSGKFVASLGIGVVCLLLVAATFAFAMTPAQPPANAAPAAQATATPAPSKTEPASPPQAATKAPGDQGKATSPDSAPDPYQALFNKTFAAKLGVSEDALNAAFTAALSDTTAQMVKDGKLDPNAAAKLQGLAGQGPGSFLPVGLSDNKAGARGSAVNNSLETNPKLLLQNALPTIAPMLKLSPDELNAKLQDGQSLHDLAVAANVDPQTLETALMASFKSQLDAAVKAGKITQAQADDAAKTANSFVDGFVNAAGNPIDKNIKTLFNSDATWQAAAQALNLPVNTLRDRVDKGETVLQIAQAQQVNESQLREALQASLQSQVAALVKDGKVSADQSAQITAAFPKIVDGFVNQGGLKSK